MRILVTGANGFIGSHLVEHLLADGHNVRCLIRPTSNPRYITDLPVEIQRSTLDDHPGLVRACSGIDVVFHLAGTTRAVKPMRFYEVNCLGTEALLRACKEASPDITRFILMSSIAASGPSIGPLPQDESAAPAPVDAYGRSKLAAERSVQTASDCLPTVIVRAAAVYGPRDRDVLLFFKMVQSGWGLVFAEHRDQATSLIHVHDLCRLLLAVLTTHEAVQQTYFASDGHLYRLEDVLAELSDVLGRRVRIIPIPTPFLRIAAKTGGIWSRLSGKPALLNPDRMHQLERPGWTCSIEKARRELNFAPQVPLRQGLAETARWYKEQGWI